MQAEPIQTDAVIIGAGPVGLFQVFELGLLGIKAHVIDSLAVAGGQCAELYPDKPIYDIPAVPLCTGRELTDRLLQQIKPFGATFHLGQEVSHVECRLSEEASPRFFVETSQGTQFLSKTVFIAGGVGSFQPKRLKVQALEAFEGTQLRHAVRDSAAFAGQQLVIVGEGDAALDWARHFAHQGPQQAASVVLIHRRDVFTAAPDKVARMRALCDAGLMRLVIGQITEPVVVDGRLQQLQVLGSDGKTMNLPLDQLLVLQGLSPKLGPIADWGLDIERKQLLVDTEKFETSTPGIFAVGDINTYPGKKKLILCGFHEATLAAFGACAYVFPGQPVLLQYTTTSPKLHRALGVAPPLQT